ncbi:restriction endonuclease subunit S [Acinetobacter parvus]|nr:restriction endonuclease subunit S [Acinetobacter parvus]
MSFIVFEELFEIPLRNGLTKPKRIRGEGYKMVNMGELFAYPRINNLVMDRAPLNEKEKESSLLKTGDLLFARQSLVREGAGQCSIFLNDQEEVCFESHLIRCRLKQDIANPTFYFYFFSSCLGKKIINTIVEQGAGAAGIRGSDLAKLIVPKPSIVIQERIAKILSDLDDKIHLNNQINQTLESIAQAIFKSWFIDFEPVRAKIAAKQEGSDPELAAMCAISGKSEAELDQLTKEDFAELQATAALFPDELVESELGEVPRGWELQQLKDIAKYSSNKILLNDLNLENYISTENMLPEKKGIEKASSLPKANSVPAFRQGNILVSNIRPYFKKIWFSFFDGGHSNDVLNFDVLEKGTEEYLYNLIYQDSFFDRMMASSKGSKMPRGDKKAIMDFQIVTSSVALRKLYSEKVRKFYSKQNSIKIENQILINLRDALLPKLLSGELDVSGLQGEGIDG